MKGIKKFHHFFFEASKVFVSYKEFIDSQALSFSLLSDGVNIDDTEMPTILRPLGLTPKRHWYFYNELRDFVSEGKKDLVARRPNFPESKKKIYRRNRV